MSIFNMIGGGGAVDMESGTFTPASDATAYQVSFAKTHATTPDIILVQDSVTRTSASASIFNAWGAIDVFKLFGTKLRYTSGSSTRYANAVFYYSGYNTNSAYSDGLIFKYVSSATDTSTTYRDEYMSTTGFTAGNYGSYCFKANRTYKWVAIWLS